jgi:hypothetical protein
LADGNAGGHVYHPRQGQPELGWFPSIGPGRRLFHEEKFLSAEELTIDTNSTATPSPAKS